MKELKIRDASRNFSMLTAIADEDGKVSITRRGTPAYVMMTAEEYSRFAGEEWQVMEKLRKSVWLIDQDDAICKLQLSEDFLCIYKETPEDGFGDAGVVMFKYPIRKVDVSERKGSFIVETRGIAREMISSYQYSAQGDVYIFVKELEALKKSQKVLRRGKIKISF